MISLTEAYICSNFSIWQNYYNFLYFIIVMLMSYQILCQPKNYVYSWISHPVQSYVLQQNNEIEQLLCHFMMLKLHLMIFSISTSSLSSKCGKLFQFVLIFCETPLWNINRNKVSSFSHYQLVRSYKLSYNNEFKKYRYQVGFQQNLSFRIVDINYMI